MQINGVEFKDARDLELVSTVCSSVQIAGPDRPGQSGLWRVWCHRTAAPADRFAGSAAHVAVLLEQLTATGGGGKAQEHLEAVREHLRRVSDLPYVFWTKQAGEAALSWGFDISSGAWWFEEAVDGSTQMTPQRFNSREDLQEALQLRARTCPVLRPLVSKALKSLR